ncbi:MAG: helix-turn-helix domain-containing protein [Egibacteraceae bacterium]
MEPESVGERIAYWRRRRGISQKALAGLVGRSASWMTKVEGGDRIIDKLSVLLALSYALKVDLGKLIGGVELPPNGGGPLDPPRGIVAVRRPASASSCTHSTSALDPPRGIVAVRRALFTVRPPDREPPAMVELRADVEQAKRLREAGRYEAVGVVLPELITAGRASAAVQDTPPGVVVPFGAYQVASALSRTVGERDWALLTADRAATAAQRPGAGLMVAVSELLLALAPTDTTPLKGWSVWGRCSSPRR